MRLAATLVLLTGLFACAPSVQTRWVTPEGRNFAADQGECKRRALVAVPLAPITPYTPPPPPTNPYAYTSPYSVWGDALQQAGTDMQRTAQEIAQRDLYVTTCLEAFGYELEYL